MQQSSLADFATQVVEIHGPRAETEAARQADLCEKHGKIETAQTWRLVHAEIGRLRDHRVN